MKLWLSYQAGKKINSGEEKGFVKIWELDSDNSDFYSDSSVESDTDESSDSLRSIGILSMHIRSASLSFVCFLRPATLAFVSFFVFPILPDQLQEKNLSALSALRNARVFWRFARKFFQTLLSDLRTQLKGFVGGVGLRSKRFFLSLFPRINFFA